MTHNYRVNQNNPFFSLEDDVDDETFLKGANNHHYSAASNHLNNYEDKHQQLLQAKKEIEERTLESSNRSLNLLRHSEDIGISTAEELIRQREQLEATDNRLDDINSTLRFSQKHIQSIKSVFGGFKNYLSGNKTEAIAPSTSSKLPRETSSDLVKSIETTSRTSDNAKMMFNEQHFEPMPKSNISAVLEKNLDEMCGSLSRLKNLAVDLSVEIDEQNDLIDNIADKTEKADIMLQKQDRDIRKLLKK